MLEKGGTTPGGDPRAVLVVEDSENSASLLEIAFLRIPRVSILLASSAFDRLEYAPHGRLRNDPPDP